MQFLVWSIHLKRKLRNHKKIVGGQGTQKLFKHVHQTIDDETPNIWKKDENKTYQQWKVTEKLGYLPRFLS